MTTRIPAVETTQDFINEVKGAAKSGQVFKQAIGVDGGFALTVSPDGSAVCHLFGEMVASLPTGSTPDEILAFWSESVRKFAPAYGETSGTLTFVKDLKEGDIIVDDEDDLISKVVCMIGRGVVHVTLVSHGYFAAKHRGGKQIQKFVQYPEGSMKAVDLLWGAHEEIIYQND